MTPPESQPNTTSDGGARPDPTSFIFALHNHQPVGNFDHVMADACDNCYSPSIRILEEFSAVKTAIHFSGPLLEWIEANRPELIDLVGRLVERGQVELLGGGMFEPMLSVLPERDAVGQIRMMADRLEHRFGTRPRGMWLAERVWEPDLARILSRAEVEFTFLDDAHFRAAGATDPIMKGVYVTEKAGESVRILPIDQGLRYKIPFSQAHEVVDYLAANPGLLTYGDDGEKFGVWPGTRKWVFEEGWLRSFFSALSDSTDRVQTVLPSEAVANTRPSGRIYLPTASYEEMMEWSLPPKAGMAYHRLRDELGHAGLLDHNRPFIRGGIWQNFLAKYPESNGIHKKMILVSKMVESAEAAGFSPEQVGTAREHLYRGQCNCAYWHGLFGGLYLGNLRHALYSELLAAERLVSPTVRTGEASAEIRDFDLDGTEELLLGNGTLNAYVSPARGGGVFELDHLPSGYNLLDILARRPESYHALLRAHLEAGGDGDGEGDAPRSIHDQIRVKDPGLLEKLTYDSYQRMAFLDHFLSPGANLESLRSGHGVAPDADAPFEVVGWGRTDRGVEVRLRRALQGPAAGLTLDKRFFIADRKAAIEVEYLVRGGTQDRELLLAIETPINLLAGHADDRSYLLPDGSSDFLDSIGETPGERIGLIDRWAGIDVRIAGQPFHRWWRFPQETVSQSEGGFESTFQGSVVCAIADLHVPAGETWAASLRLEVSGLGGEANEDRGE